PWPRWPSSPRPGDPMTPEEYAALDGLGLAEAIRKGETTPLEAVDAAIAIIERRNPVLNAVVHTAFEEARRQALDAAEDAFAELRRAAPGLAPVAKMAFLAQTR
ncbi:MAG: hypothetical protein ACKN9P_16380, partial [Phenylobacterium sp.]